MLNFKRIKEEDKELLINIFTNIQDDPNWTEDSFLMELFNSRISIAEFFGLLAADREWSHMAIAAWANQGQQKVSGGNNKAIQQSLWIL